MSTIPDRHEELALLIEEQARDMRHGHIVSSLSLDAPTGNNGTLLDLVDENGRLPRVDHRDLPMAPGDPRHGTLNGYRNLGCRCSRCRAAQALRQRRLRCSGLPDGDRRHGTTSGYVNYGCRCERCYAAGVELRSARRR